MYKVNATTIRDITAPTVNDDNSKGVQVGWRWLNTISANEYICASNETGAAVWNPVGSGASGGTPDFTISIVDWYCLNPSVSPVSNAGNYTLGSSFFPSRSVRVKGIRFYWASATADTVVCKLWDDTASAVASVNVVTSGIGIYSGLFSAPYDIPTNKINYRHHVTIRQNTGANYTYSLSTSPRSGAEFGPLPLACLPGIVYDVGGSASIYFYVAGDARPTTAATGEKYPTEAIFDYSV